MTAAAFVVGAAGVFAGGRAVSYVADLGGVRHRAETAWIWYGVAATLVAATLIRNRSTHASLAIPRDGVVPAFLPASALLAFIAFAFLIYWPAIGIGLLSDDFVLLGWAERGEWLPAEWPYVRIVPLVLWRITHGIAGETYTPAALHLVTVVMHALNGHLVAQLASAFGLGRTVALIAALLFIAYPTSVEATAWASAMPDVMVTLFILSALRAALLIDDEATSVAVVLVCTLAALFTKENAVVTGAVLIATAAFPDSTQRSRLLRAGGAAVAVTVVFLIFRVFGVGLADVERATDRLAIKNFIAAPYAFFGLPVHADQLTITRPWWTVWTLILSGACAAAAFVWRARPWIARMMLWSVAWVLITTLPTFGFLVVTSDLQNTRYIYLAAVGWCLALAAHVPPLNPANPRSLIGVAAGVFAIVLFVATTRAHLANWTAAADVRDRALRMTNALVANCPRIHVTGVPDHISGAYVFRNGLPEALARLHGRTIEVTMPPADGASIPTTCRLDLATQSGWAPFRPERSQNLRPSKPERRLPPSPFGTWQKLRVSEESGGKSRSEGRWAVENSCPAPRG